MTEIPNHPSEPTRALDDVPAPDQWDDIVDRASNVDGVIEGLAPGNDRWAKRPVFLAAAAVVLVAVVAGGLALAARDGDSPDQVVAGPSAAGRLDDPANLVGRTWELERFISDGSELLVPDPQGYSPPTFSVTEDGQVSFKGCNNGGAAGAVEGDRLVISEEWLTTLMGCMGPEGEALMALDDAMGELVRAEPRVELTQDALSLVAGTSEAHFVERTDGRPGTTDGDVANVGEDGDTAGVMYLPSGDATCEVGLDPSVDPEASWPIGPGAASPPVLDGWWASQRESGDHGTWNVHLDDQRVEIDVRGLVVIDLDGERTEEVTIGAHGTATVWFMEEWVQVRSFTGGPDSGPCGSFTVTAAGGDETANRDAAVAIATSLVVRERAATTQDEPEVESSDDGPPPTIPSTEGARDADARAIVEGPTDWVLDAIQIDGQVERPATSPSGGTDGSGGPIVISRAAPMAGMTLHGCGSAPQLSLDERNGRPWLSLPSNQVMTSRCPADADLQWGAILKILSLGAVPRLVDTERGPVLVIANEEGSAAFWHP